MSRKRILKLPRVIQFSELMSNVGTHVALSRSKFPKQFLPAVNYGNDIFQIATPEVVALPRSWKASNFEAQKYTEFTNRIFRPGSNSRISAVFTAGPYQTLRKPKSVPSTGITSRVVVF
jgi:hypothetical protein